jgi:hypothetical protein
VRFADEWTETGVRVPVAPIPISIRVEIPTARRLSFEVVRRPEQRKEQATGWLNRLRETGGTVQRAIELTERFGVLVRDRLATRLDAHPEVQQIERAWHLGEETVERFESELATAVNRFPASRP